MLDDIRKKRICSVDLNTAGTVGDLDSIVQESDSPALDHFRRFLSTLSPAEPKEVDVRIRICSTFLVRRIREINRDQSSRLHAFEELGWIGDLALEGAVDIIEHSWIDSDVDAIEYQYWSCGVLSEFDPSSCENRILERMASSVEVRKQVSLIQALAVLADHNHLSGLGMATVKYILELYRNQGQSSDVRYAAREALVDDFLRIDSHLHFLEKQIRLEIESVQCESKDQ